MFTSIFLVAMTGNDASIQKSMSVKQKIVQHIAAYSTDSKT